MFEHDLKGSQGGVVRLFTFKSHVLMGFECSI